jgi:hypothetical protein
MPSIAMYEPPATPDAWHRVMAPGGYEWWYFDAEDAATDTQVVAIFLEGFVFHTGYLRAYARFVRNPTAAPPPLPGDWPCVYLCVYRAGRSAPVHDAVRAADFRASQTPSMWRSGRTRSPATATRSCCGSKARRGR